MPSDDELRRIARRLFEDVAALHRITVQGVEHYMTDEGSSVGEAYSIDGEAAIALREEIEALATKIRSQNWIQEDGELIADPFATVVHTTDY